MDSALIQIDYQFDGVNYSRQVFASYPDQVMVYRLTAGGVLDIAPSNTLTLPGRWITPSGRTAARISCPLPTAHPSPPSSTRPPTD
jgi:alpha-L-fucosidase 2